ncbi:hypothetical protein KIN20_031312 [Parelaphostrongylus tenuis]|uniref:Uncharacterized protein n=1 Tax=Parelaphostrongylus tenuis TaxID=148309 RepID=A0AAD5R5B9_PARTN|nr:hypothetical protein KIN20_031312 [Parelaphostrongylus tenuis]
MNFFRVRLLLSGLLVCSGQETCERGGKKYETSDNGRYEWYCEEEGDSAYLILQRCITDSDTKVSSI